MFERLADKCPSCERKRLDALVAVWSRELELILKRMFTICAEGAPLRLPEEVRHEAAFELARLTLWLEDKIVAVRTSATPIDELDPETEERSVNSPEGQQRIDNTARMCAEQIWKRLQEDWWKRFPAIRKAPARRGKILTASGRSQGVRQQHFSPAFSNKLWANEPDKKVTVYARGVDNKITSKHVPYRSWGRESFIYSQKLEQLFGLIEGDAKKPYTKLLNVEPFSEEDRRHWVAFLAAQMFRTPWFISQNLAHLKTVIETRSLRYPTDIGSLRRAYETLFTNDDIFAFVYKLVVHRKWELWHPSAGAQFVRSDNPVVVSVQKAGGLTVLYPISPERCFVAGPEPADSNPQIVPGRRQLNEAQTDAAIRVIAETGQKTVIARPDRQDAHLRKVLESSLGRRWVRASRFRLLLPGYWGELLR